MKKSAKQLPMKKRIGDTAKQTGIGALSIAGGTASAASLGKLAPFAGLLMLGVGYFLGGKWQLLTLAGAATMGYGIAKASENRLEESLKERLVTFKNDWLNGLYIDKLINKPTDGSAVNGTSIGAIDLSEMDFIDEQLTDSANEFEEDQFEEAEEDDFLLATEMAAPIDAIPIDAIPMEEELIDFSTI